MSAPLTKSSSTTSLAERISQFACGLDVARVPADVRLRAKHLILDGIGCALAARHEDFAVQIADAVIGLDGTESGPTKSGVRRAVIGHSFRLPMRDAAFLNGALAHGLDFDDTHTEAITHLTVSVFPAVLALGAQLRVSGADALAAYIAGVEAGARIASTAKGAFHARGFHPTGMVGVFACAIACGRLLGLETDAATRAQGLALSMASGSLQFLEDGASTKRLHPGWAAQAGIVAACMARWPIPAPSQAYEGRYGLYALYMDAEDQGLSYERFDSLGSKWEVPNVAVKPFPICHLSHAATDAAIALHAQLGAEGIDLEDVRRIDVLVPQAVMPVVCEPLEAKRAPTTDYEAKFSLPFAVACGLRRGRLGLADLLPASLSDEQLLGLARRIHCKVDKASTFPNHYTGEVVLTLDDGRTVAHRESVNRGHAERPLTNAEVVAKFDDNASRYFSREAVDHLRSCVLSVDSSGDLAALEEALAIEPIC